MIGTFELWDVLVIAVIAWAVVEINRNYLKARHGKLEKEGKRKRLEYPESLIVWGLVIFAIGLGVYLGFYISIGTGLWLTLSFIPLFIGTALFIAYAIVRPKKRKFLFWK